MMKLLAIATIALSLGACNNEKSEAKQTAKDSSIPATALSSAWTRDDEMEFMDGCVEKSAPTMGEEKAFNTCKCILRQIQTKNPANDSTQTALLMTDTTQMAAMAQACK